MNENKLEEYIKKVFKFIIKYIYRVLIKKKKMNGYMQEVYIFKHYMVIIH